MKNQVKVELAVQQPLPFSSMFMQTAPLIKATARAASVPAAGEVCVVSLREQTQDRDPRIAATPTIIMDCGMITNSTCDQRRRRPGQIRQSPPRPLAASAESSSRTTGRSANYHPYSPPLADPYANLNPDPAEKWSCASAPRADSARQPNIGRAPCPVADCCYSSIDISSNKDTDAAGTALFFINGGNVNIQGTCQLHECTHRPDQQEQRRQATDRLHRHATPTAQDQHRPRRPPASGRAWRSTRIAARSTMRRPATSRQQPEQDQRQFDRQDQGRALLPEPAADV